MATPPLPDAPLSELTSVRLVEPGRFEIDVPDGWQQGRGAFGGLVIGALARAAEAAGGDASRTVRSITAELCGPTMPGKAEIRTRTLRAGTGVTTITASLEQSAEVQAHGVFVLGRARDEIRSTVLPPPRPPAWRDVPPVPALGGGFPTFAAQWEYRNVGPVPFAGGTEPLASGWVRPKNPGATCDTAWVVACADAYWPALFSTERGPRPMATVAYTLTIVGDLAVVDPAEPVFHVGRAVARGQGYVVETREIWSSSGELLALNHQTFVVIK